MRTILPSPWSPPRIIEEVGSHSSINWASATWPSANMGMIVPVHFPVDCTVYSLSACGTNTTGNYDLAFYDESYARLASLGSTAMATGALSLSLPDIRVRAGKLYYAAMACSGAATLYALTSGDTSYRFLVQSGLGVQASAVPLPDPFVPAAVAVLVVPLFAFQIR